MNSDQTNLYAEQHFQSNPDDKRSRFLTPTTTTEIQHFLMLYFLSGIVQISTVLEYRFTSSDFSFQSRYDQKQVPEDLAVSIFC